ncbi:response regulator transcription factor [Wandonia haliotis]|uniref:Response regulator transcription factor n=1 Tax=Wandonia haliotis TaxID=574963 RepID=A0ABN1MTZ8_9FLAO
MKVVIADDHPIFRSGVKSLLEASFEDIEIQEFTNGKEAADSILKESPDIAILDIDMPVMTGLQVCQEVSEQSETKLIILTMYNDIEMQRKAFNSGAVGYLVKDHTSEELVQCIHEVLEGKRFSAQGLRKMEEESEGKIKNLLKKLEQLTQVELKTLKLVSQKYTSKEISDLLFISVKSVENYRSRICKKLELDARNNSLLLWVMENKPYLDEIEEF